METLSPYRAQRTQMVFIGIRLLGTPCWAILSILAFILYKYTQATPFQIAVLIALKPASSLFSPYWSQAIYQRPDRIISNLTGGNILRYLPFLFVPWIDSSWFLILAFGFYMMLTRATIPAWMEILKYNLPDTRREKMVGYGSTIDFCGTALITVGIGSLLDYYPEIWKWLFTGAAALGIFSTWFLRSLILPQIPHPTPPPVMKNRILKPWSEVWHLLYRHKGFTLFQIGFMLGGGGLMIMHPALPQFFVDILDLSFVEMGLALALCKGVGVALTSHLWARLFRRVNLFYFSALVTFFAALFPFLLLASSYHLVLLYVAYIFYGIMQGGSEMSWHMSGLVFAKEGDSSIFSITNVLTVGIRGCILPFLGSFLLGGMDAWGVMLLGAFFCLLASLHFLFFCQKKSKLVLDSK